MPKIGEHAVVLGASMGGLLAARALADFYEKVTVVERDVLPDDPINRRGVPHPAAVVAVLRRAARERDGPLPSIDVADALLDESRELAKRATTVGQGQAV